MNSLEREEIFMAATYGWTEKAVDVGPAASIARRTARVVERGVTLVEVLIVVAIMSMMAAAVVVAVIPKFKDAQIKTADQNAREIRNAVTRYRARGTDTCPTVAQLKSEKEIDSASNTNDPWGSGYKSECGDDEIYVSSPGPDKKEGTADDIAVPKKGAQ
jgi:general secretion pathway protein G